jgi:hypothetical protein
VDENSEYKGVKTLLLLRSWANPLGNNVAMKFVRHMPEEGSVYNYCYSPVEKRWKTWEDTITEGKKF